ncbi:MAG: MBL fold metallo-hydrolase [Actinomycetia bacterium]|nr:MBL fold metallo-hydrolase [Actinomycetes bacterium]
MEGVSSPESASSTNRAISPDSGTGWAQEGAWAVAPGVYRIPLPLPGDGLIAINVYVIETDDGLTLIDGGWSIAAARNVLERSLASIEYRFSDIRTFLVTHVHRDHYTQARLLGTEFGAAVALGIGERPTLDLIQSRPAGAGANARVLRECGAGELAAAWERQAPGISDLAEWLPPDTWLEDDHAITVGQRQLQAVSTPGHTQGHYVFTDESAGLLFAGDHVLPTITPSIGFEGTVPEQPLGDFLASLVKVQQLPDLQILPAHGPVGMSSHARVAELLAHHDHRLDLCRAALASGEQTTFEVADQLPWTRRERALNSMDEFNAGLAVLETRVHLRLLVQRGEVTVRRSDGVDVYSLAHPSG